MTFSSPPMPPLKPTRTTKAPSILKDVSKPTLAQLRNPRPFKGSSMAPVVPSTTLKGSITEHLLTQTNRTSLGISNLTPKRCEQYFAFSFVDPPEPTERSKLGIQLHEAYQAREKETGTRVDSTLTQTKAVLKQTKKTATETKGPQYVPFSTPEEEAAHMFLYVPWAMDVLLKKHMRFEFSIFGFFFERAFHGSVDEVQVTTDPKTGSRKIQIHEIKTLDAEQAKLIDEVKLKATLQASLYRYFMQIMFDKNEPFDFQTYFRARGLNWTRPFLPTFSANFAKLQVPGMNPNRQPPIDLRSLVAQWQSYVRQLPPLVFDKYVYITTVQQAHVPNAAGFARLGRTNTECVPAAEFIARQAAEDVLALLDGRRLPEGVPGAPYGLCQLCPFKEKCPWVPKNHRNDVLSRWHPTQTEMGSATQPIIAPVPSRYTRRKEMPTVISGPRSMPAVLQKRVLMPKQQHARDAILARLVAKIRRESPKLKRVRTRPDITRILQNIRKAGERLPAMQRIRIARKALAEKRKEQERAKLEAKKAERVQHAAQMKALRERLAMRRRALAANPKERSTRFTGLVPYVAPTRASSDVDLFRPSFARARAKRKEAERPKGASIPSTGQALPEDETFSMAKFTYVPPASRGWTYEFDSLPSLADQQLALTQEEALNDTSTSRVEMEVLTDAESEEFEREDARARRREERKKRQQREEREKQCSV